MCKTVIQQHVTYCETETNMLFSMPKHKGTKTSDNILIFSKNLQSVLKKSSKTFM